jgi:hypothetical protein
MHSDFSNENPRRPRPQKNLADNAAKRARLKHKMIFAVNCRSLLSAILPAVLAFTLAGCVGSKQFDESIVPKPKQGGIVDVRDFLSPDGRFICTVFGETFYDTTGYRRHIDIRRAGEQRGFPGNVYVVEVGDDVEVSWLSPTNLSVRLSYETPWFQHALPANTNIAGVTVVFSKLTN